MEPVIREFVKKDIGESVLETLRSLTDAPEIPEERFEEIWDYISSNPLHFILVAEVDGKIVSMVTLLIEPKFIHGGSYVGHIEDVATHQDYKGRGIGSMLQEKGIMIAKEKGCYKIILDCSEANIPYYERFDYKVKEVCMRLDL